MLFPELNVSNVFYLYTAYLYYYFSSLPFLSNLKYTLIYDIYNISLIYTLTYDITRIIMLSPELNVLNVFIYRLFTLLPSFSNLKYTLT